MKIKIFGFLCVLTSLTIWMIIAGCASNRFNLVEAGTISIEHLPSKGHLFTGTSVYQEGHVLIIRGEISRRNASNIGGGHVDIAIVSPENEILEKISTHYTLRVIPRDRRRGGSVFEVRLPRTPPYNGSVRIAYHRIPESENHTFHCKQNAAAPL